MNIPDSNYFISGSTDKTLMVWNKADGAHIKTITGHEGGVRSLSMSSDGNVISGSEDKNVKVWKTGSWECLLTMEGHDDFVRTVKGLSNMKVASGSI